MTLPHASQSKREQPAVLGVLSSADVNREIHNMGPVGQGRLVLVDSAKAMLARFALFGGGFAG